MTTDPEKGWGEAGHGRDVRWLLALGVERLQVKERLLREKQVNLALLGFGSVFPIPFHPISLSLRSLDGKRKGIALHLGM